MANHVSSLKRARQTVTKTAINRANKSKLRGALRLMREALAAGDKKTLVERLPLHRLGPRQERPEGCPAQEHRQPLQGPSQRPRQGRSHQGRLNPPHPPQKASPALASFHFPPNPGTSRPTPAYSTLARTFYATALLVSVSHPHPRCPSSQQPHRSLLDERSSPAPCRLHTPRAPIPRASHRPHRPSPRRLRASPRRSTPDPLRPRARLRPRLHRHRRRPLHRLLQVRLRQLRRQPPHPLRPARASTSSTSSTTSTPRSSTASSPSTPRPAPAAPPTSRRSATTTPPA